MLDAEITRVRCDWKFVREDNAARRSGMRGHHKLRGTRWGPSEDWLEEIGGTKQVMAESKFWCFALEQWWSCCIYRKGGIKGCIIP